MEWQMQKPLAGKVAIVTGSGKNIGKAIVTALAGHGAAVVVNGRGDRSIVEETAAEIRNAGGRALPFIADISKPDAVAAMVEAAVKEFGGVDIAVGNAGLRRQTPFLEMNLASGTRSSPSRSTACSSWRRRWCRR
jgi:3-oxoacyl-[acyl-carrier protein] reductase